MFGVVSILGLTPLLGFAIRLIPLQPVEYIIGIVVMAIVPTSMGVGIALATMAKVSWMCRCMGDTYLQTFILTSVKPLHYAYYDRIVASRFTRFILVALELA